MPCLGDLRGGNEQGFDVIPVIFDQHELAPEIHERECGRLGLLHPVMLFFETHRRGTAWEHQVPALLGADPDVLEDG